MIHKTGMTIDAYLRDAGLRSDSSTAHKKFIPLKARSGSSFADRLAAAMTSQTSPSLKNNAGLALRDYWNQAARGASAPLVSNRAVVDGAVRHFGPDRTRYPAPVVQAEADTDGSTDDGDAISAGSGGRITGNKESLGQEITDSIKSAARKYNLPEKLIKSVIQAESNFQPDAVSPAGAQGLMQLMPATAKARGVEDPFDVRQNIDGGAGYLRQMLDRFGQDVRLALAAYNAGPGTVEKYSGNVPYRETQMYVERVLKGALA